MKLRFVSDGTHDGSDVQTPDGECFPWVKDCEVRMDWGCGCAVPTAKVTLARVEHIDIIAESQLECVHDGRRYAMTDIGPAEDRG